MYTQKWILITYLIGRLVMLLRERRPQPLTSTWKHMGLLQACHLTFSPAERPFHQSKWCMFQPNLKHAFHFRSGESLPQVYHYSGLETCARGQTQTKTSCSISDPWTSSVNASLMPEPGMCQAITHASPRCVLLKQSLKPRQDRASSAQLSKPVTHWSKTNIYFPE